MNDSITAIMLSLMAGIHAASYGAWKDSPSESYILRRSIRELSIALSIGIVLAWLHVLDKEPGYIIYLSSYTINRFITEFYKLFVRVEPQAHYRIPTQIHWFGTVLQSKIRRLLFGLYAVAIVSGVYIIGLYLPRTLSWQIHGVLIGLLIGLADASGGAYKDGSIEGFYIHKFVKSPLLGALGGFIISYKTTSTLFLLFGTIAVMRMLIELIFKILSKGYVPGKFVSMEPVYPVWKKRRWAFLLPYTITWVVFIYLFFS